jgi:hypothetical protein
VKGVTIIESYLGMKQNDPLKGPLFVLAHYWALLNTCKSPNYVFPSLMDNTHIVGPMSEITHPFDHLLT